MRVIAGTHRGRALHAPKGASTRPTTDRVRESLFSALASMRGGLDGAVVLDAFAGSGALGIEALSRGAAFCTFCERNRAALDALARNSAFLDPDSFRIARGDVLKRLPAAPAPFDLVLLDPPYAQDPGDLAALLARLDAAGSLADGAIVSHERATQGSPRLQNGSCPLEWTATKAYGDTAIDLYRKEPA